MRLPRYLAVAGPRDPFGLRRPIAASMADLGFAAVASSPRLQVYTNASAALLLAGGSGAVIGPIFEQGGAMERVTAFSEDTDRRIVTSRGQVLIEEFWGDYVAFVAGEEDAVILRPPFSDLGCVHADRNGLTLVASDLDLLTRCGVPTGEPDWTEIASHLRTGGLRGAATCVAGVQELLWGNRMSVSLEGIRKAPCWTPWKFALSPRGEPRARLAEELRDLLLACVKTQVEHLGAVNVMLSGGLDSSILAACLARSGPRLTCLNLPFGDTIGDERVYARTVAAHLGVPLFEAEPDVKDVDVTLCASPGLARPIARSFLQPAQAIKVRIAAATGAQDCLDGGGGDGLFGSMQSGAPIADRLLRHGPGLGVIESAVDMARLTGVSTAEVVTRAFRRALMRPRSRGWSLDERFLAPSAIAHAGTRGHPWLEAPRGGLPGSATHIANMVVSENLLEIGNGPVAEWSPLVVQPLVEFCLSVPSWLWFENGHNRAVARRAFADLLPPEIVWRRGKGTPDGFVARIFEFNRDRLTELLIGGRLDRAGFLDAQALRAALTPDRPIKGHDYTRVLRIADVEAWVRALGKAQPTPLQAPPATASGGARSVTIPSAPADPPDA